MNDYTIVVKRGKSVRGWKLAEGRIPAYTKLYHIIQNSKIKNTFLKRFIYFYYKVRYTERRRNREEDLPSDGLLPK